MNDFNHEVSVTWDEVVASFDPRFPISKVGAIALFDRAIEEENPEDRLWFILMSVMWFLTLAGDAPYSDSACLWISQGLLQIHYEGEQDDELSDDDDIREMIKRGFLDPGDVNAYLAAREQEDRADQFDWADSYE